MINVALITILSYNLDYTYCGQRQLETWWPSNHCCYTLKPVACIVDTFLCKFSTPECAVTKSRQTHICMDSFTQSLKPKFISLVTERTQGCRKDNQDI